MKSCIYIETDQIGLKNFTSASRNRELRVPENVLLYCCNSSPSFNEIFCKIWRALLFCNIKLRFEFKTFESFPLPVKKIWGEEKRNFVIEGEQQSESYHLGSSQIQAIAQMEWNSKKNWE